MLFANLTIEIDKRSPTRSNRFSEQCHFCLGRQFISFLGIAPDTGTNNIFPGCHTSLVLGNHMVKVQVFTLEMLTAVLAHMAITVQDILTGKLDLLSGQTIKRS